MLQYHCKGTYFSPNNQKKTQKKITNLMIFLDSDCLLQVCLSYISANVATFLIQPILLYILQINKENIPQIDIQPIFQCDFCSFLAKIELKSQNICISLDFSCMDVPELFSELSSELFWFSPNFSPNFYSIHIYYKRIVIAM